MPTNKERREIAEYLRNMCIYGCSYKEEFYDLLVDNVMDELYDPEFSDVADRLAELIEPEERTCRVIMKWDGLDGRDPVCSECGTYFDDKKWHEQQFCPNCGARVVQQ